MTGERTDIKEQLKEETGLEFLNKFKLWEKLKSVVGDLKDKLGFNKKTEESSQIFEIPDIFGDRIKSEIEEKNKMIRLFCVPKTDFHLKNNVDCIRNLALKITDSREYKDLKDFIDNNMSPAIRQNFSYYNEYMNKKMDRWKNGDIKIREDTAKTFAGDCMKIFGDYMIEIIKSIYQKLEYKDNLSEREHQLYLNFLEVVNKYISSVGIYAPCDVLGGMIYDSDDPKHLNFMTYSYNVSDVRLNGYIQSVDCLAYIIDCDYNGKIKSVLKKGSIYTFVKG